MRSEVRCANCGKTEWTDSGKVMFIPREGVDFGGRWIHGADCGGDEVPVDELLQLQKEADWKRALNEYRQVREEIGRLEETGECACNVNEFHTCSLCAETTSLDQRARTLMNLWGDTWAMRLITAITFDIGVKSISQGPAREETIKAIQEDYENGAFGAFTSFDAVRTALATAYDAGAQSRTPTNLESRTVAPQLEVSQWIDTELWNFVHGLALDLGVSLDAAGDKAKEEMIHRSMASVIVICSKLAGAAALPATPNGSAEYYRRSADVHQVAEDIIRRVVSNVLEIAHTRYSLDDVADADPIDKAEFKEDGLQVALGEDTGCLDPDSLSAENCEVLYVEKELFDLLARAASVPAASAPTNLESTDTYNLALAARMHESARANKTRVADSIPASSPEPNQGLSLSLISETIHAMSLHDLIMRRLKEVLPAPPVAQKDQK